MDVVPILSTIILISTIITLIVAVASYMTFRVKERRKQQASALIALETVDEDGMGEIVEMPVEDAQASQPQAQAPAPAPVQATPTSTTTVVVNQPPVVVGMPYPMQQQNMPPQGAGPGYPQAQQGYPQSTPQYDAYPPQLMPPPQPEPTYSGAQAAFMKSFGGAPDSPPAPVQQPGTVGPDGTPFTMRRFAMPEPRQAKPKQSDSYHDETPSWK